MAKDFDLTISREELNRLAPDLLACVKEFTEYGLCRMNNTAERKMSAEHFKQMAQAALKKFPDLKLNHVGAKTIIIDETPAKDRSWFDTIPACLGGDVDDASDLAEAVHLARIQLDLIEEGQDGTDHYTARDIKAIKRWIAKNDKAVAQ